MWGRDLEKGDAAQSKSYGQGSSSLPLSAELLVCEQDHLGPEKGNQKAVSQTIPELTQGWRSLMFLPARDERPHQTEHHVLTSP